MHFTIKNFVRNTLASALLLAPLAAMANQAAMPPKSVHFSEWLKDNPDVARQRTLGAVPENEIRATMSAALQQAIQRSPQLRQSLAEQKAAQADIREAEGQLLPQIDLGANTRPRSIGGNENANSGSQAVNLNMTTNLFDWGRTRSTINSRKSLSTAADQEYLVSLEGLAEEVSTNLVELEKNRRIGKISQQYVDRMSALVDMLQEIVTVDRGRASELTQARARLLEAKSNLESSEARLRDTEIRLRKLIGEAPVSLPENEYWTLTTSDLDRLVSASHEHPAVRQADARAKASEEYAKSLKAGEKPQLNWVVNKSSGRDELGREHPWQTTLSVSWPLFRGGSASAAREAAYARADVERERKAQQQLDLEYATRTSEQDARTLLNRAESYRQLTSETDNVRKAFFEQWYHLGRRTLLDVLIAESDYNNNRVSEVSSRFDGYQAVLKSYASAGRLTLWMRGLNTPY
nr:hypothetical protein FFPRI1PSEUD_24300 [Pseudomonas sp. FFPRI_1]